MIFVTAAIIAVAAQAPAADAQALARGRALTQLLLAGETAALEPQLAPAFLAAIGGRDGLARFTDLIAAQAGPEQEVLREAAFREAGHLSYYRVSRFEKLPEVTTRWVIGPDGQVVGMSVRPSPAPASSEHLEYRTKAQLRLPFGRPAQEGRWYVAWGGRTPIENYHVVAPDQRFAYDFLVARGDAIFAGTGERNADHFCWGEAVVAPAPGEIVRAVGDVPDNERPGSQREGVPPPGNHVVINHGAGEYSLVAHFQMGSLAVREGQQVAAGDRLGLCGNSGRSTVPHVHYHLQTGAAFGEGVGLPALFTDYSADGTAVARGEPVRGQKLLPD